MQKVLEMALKPYIAQVKAQKGSSEVAGGKA